MNFEIKPYDPSYIEQQVNLIWDVTESWRHEYQTSIESVTNAYNSDKFDPTTRFYAFEGKKMVGYVTSAIAEDKEKGKYGTMRFPVAVNNDEEIIESLYQKVVDRFKELGINRIRSFAGEGMGNTVELAEKFEFAQASLNFKRSKAKIDDLKLSGSVKGIMNFDDTHIAAIENLFSMLYPPGFGGGIFRRALANKERKDALGENRTSWKLMKDEISVTGFSSLNRSDHNPLQGNMMPIFFRDIPQGLETMDKLLSAHVADMQPSGMTQISTFMGRENFRTEELYNKLGFAFDGIFIYEKLL